MENLYINIKETPIAQSSYQKTIKGVPTSIYVVLNLMNIILFQQSRQMVLQLLAKLE